MVCGNEPGVLRVPGTVYPRGLNLIFFADGYLSWNEFESDAAALTSELRKYEPWKSFERWNSYYVRPNELDICAVKTENERHPVLRCAPEKLNTYLNQLTIDGHFKLIVLSRRAFESWANVARFADSGIFMSIAASPADEGSRFSLGIQFAHLMGHAFGLKDEEVYMIAKADSAGAEPDGPNCAPDKATAEQWWGNMAIPGGRVGYFDGCAGKKEYVKPTRGSLMNLNELQYLTPDYGPVSEEYLRSVLQTCFSPPGTRIENTELLARYPEFQECVAIK